MMATRSDSNEEPRAELRSVGPETCMRLIGQQGIGRFVFRSGRGPVALPVNYAVVDGDVLFCTAPESEMAADVPDAPVSFEVDRWNESARSGWSVLITGRVQRDPEGGDRESWNEAPTPWPAGTHSVLLRLIPLEISGRVLAV